MAYCPNSDASLPADAPKCDKCGALFGENTAWHPTEQIVDHGPTIARIGVAFLVAPLASLPVLLLVVGQPSPMRLVGALPTFLMAA
jgi:hypothetical protein